MTEYQEALLAASCAAMTGKIVEFKDDKSITKREISQFSLYQAKELLRELGIKEEV